MSHPLYWPGKYYTYPIGNTSAVCLTRDHELSNKKVNLLLLGCGDLRNILYTLFSEPDECRRTLDFTCVDFEPAILSRNLLLLTMIMDEIPSAMLWNIYLHIYLDAAIHQTFVHHCEKVLKVMDSKESWASSKYGRVLRFSTEHTLFTVRRHLRQYANMQNLPDADLKRIKKSFTQEMQAVCDQYKSSLNLTVSRSAGPLFSQAVVSCRDSFTTFWETGTTYTRQRERKAATLLNPTFVYSQMGDTCHVHYGTDPLIPFHLAPLVENSSNEFFNILRGAKAQFADWCAATYKFLSQTQRAVVRLFFAEATAACHALRGFSPNGSVESKTFIPISQWTSQILRLDRAEYGDYGAPSLFDVVDTSNLDDHIGLLNVLMIASPLLQETSDSVLYIEALLFKDEDATKEFTKRLYADVSVVSLLLGICPVDFLSGYTTRSSTHNILAFHAFKTEGPSQYHQVSTWKAPSSGDRLASRSPPEYAFEPWQLGTFLYDMYHAIFEQEDAFTFFRQNRANYLNAVGASNLLHLIRETFIFFLKSVRGRLRIPSDRWVEVMDRFFDIRLADCSMPMDSINYQEFCGLLHRHGVYTIDTYRFDMLPTVGPFSGWASVPPIVRVFLTVPRGKLEVLNSSGPNTPILQCDIRGKGIHNVFSAVHVSFGRVFRTGPKDNLFVRFEEDPDGWHGTMPLIASFIMPSRLMTEYEPPRDLQIRFGIRGTPASTAVFVSKLGLEFVLFAAPLLDGDQVIVIPEPAVPFSQTTLPASSPASCLPGALTQIGKAQGPVLISLDEECELVSLMSVRVNITDAEAQSIFQARQDPRVTMISPCVLRIILGPKSQDMIYPFPIVGSQYKLRLARKSLYIEALVPPAGPLKADGLKKSPFPVNFGPGGNSLTLPTIHRVFLQRLPIINLKAKDLDAWLNPHVGSMFSKRERALRKKHETDVLMFVKDTIHTLLVRSAGIQGGGAKRVFALRDKASNNCDTLFFVDKLRHDPSSHTIICEAFVLPLTDTLMSRIEKPFARLVGQQDVVTTISTFDGEMTAWKHLLPVLVERCRSGWEHTTNCEYLVRDSIPLAEEMEQDSLCSCGRGKDVDALKKNPLWSPFASHCSKIALSPLFAVSYLETVGRDLANRRCFVCRGRGKPKLFTCSSCQKTRYCSKGCQKKDWKAHKFRYH